MQKSSLAGFDRWSCKLPNAPEQTDAMRPGQVQLPAFTVALTHDADMIRKFDPLLGGGLLASGLLKRNENIKKGLARLRPRTRAADPYYNFQRYAELEQRHGFRSTFFVAAAPSDRWEITYRIDRRLAADLRQLTAAGFEVALHGSDQAYADGGILKAEKEKLADSLGDEIAGNRFHNLRSAPDQLLPVIETAGFGYDASWGFNSFCGFRDGLVAPFTPSYRERTYAFTEIPLHVMDTALFYGMHCDYDAARFQYHKLRDIAARNNGVLVIDWHISSLDEVDFPVWVQLYDYILGDLKTRKIVATTLKKLWQQVRRDCPSIDLTSDYANLC